MRKKNFIIIFFISLTAFSQKAKVVGAGSFKSAYITFTCVTVDNSHLRVPVASPYSGSVQWLGKDTLRIANYTAHILSFETTVIEITRDLRIINIYYEEEIDGQVMVYNGESPSLFLNFNPFEKGLKGLKGKYSFVAKKRAGSGQDVTVKNSFLCGG